MGRRNPTQIHQWKKQLLAGASELFHDGRTARENTAQLNPIAESCGRAPRCSLSKPDFCPTNGVHPKGRRYFAFRLRRALRGLWFGIYVFLPVL